MLKKEISHKEHKEIKKNCASLAPASSPFGLPAVCDPALPSSCMFYKKF